MVLFLVIAAALMLGVLAVLLRPLAQARVPSAGNDVAIYRDQLAEIERDAAAGLIAPDEAGAARTEVARRLLAAGAPVAEPKARPLTPGALTALLVLVPVIAAGFYALRGAPELAGLPSKPAREASLERMIGQVERHLDSNPEDGRGWEVIAPVYLRRGQFPEAVQALRRSLALNGESAGRRALLGEALAGAANGLVTAEAREAFERALALDAKEPRARYFLGLAAEQEGRAADAAERYRALLADTPPQASYAETVREALARVAPGSAGVQPAPNAAAVDAAAQMSPADRAQFIRGMVDRLAERLKTESGDVEGWLRLVRAYRVMGDQEAATSATAEARRALAADADKTKALESGLDKITPQ